jgi:hypothetical protein
LQGDEGGEKIDNNFVSQSVSNIAISAIKEMAMRSAKGEGVASRPWGLIVVHVDQGQLCTPIEGIGVMQSSQFLRTGDEKMGAERKILRQTGKALPGENPTLRARDAELVEDPGIDVGFVEREPATRLGALRGRMKVVQHGRGGSQIWIGILILVVVGVCVILGVQYF